MKTAQIKISLIVLLAFFSNVLQSANTFSVVSEKNLVTICLDKSEASVVKKAAEMFRNDVKEITGQELSIQNKLERNGSSIIAGTLGKSKILTQIIEKYKIKTDSITGRWEAFSIQIVERKEGDILVVMGSDRRGTAYGLLELSRMMGISPWIWWADVKPTKKSEITLELTKAIFQQPSVQYRGIFLNDEDWGLKPWASKTIEPETGEIGPKTYSRIFELLLRLRANTIWPAMHECTTPFYFVKGNAAMADSFGIIVSTSHCEPMMRSNPLEWDHNTRGDYNFFTNKKNVTDYWNERLSEASKYENVYTVGMRGIHDGAMKGAKTIPQQVEGLTDVIKVQREMLCKSMNKSTEAIPQIFIPYKEVLDAYDAGLNVPEDVTLVWCDDNYGYMSRLSNDAERKRKGGSGVYYHLSYWGRPHDYLWLTSTQPSFIWQEMQKSWAYGARKMWILNVGDIKPAEYLIEFYLDMAWNINAIKADGISQHLENWMGKTFGTQNAAPLKNIMNEYYRLAFIRKPEYMGWSQTEPSTKVKPTELNSSEFGNEIAIRLKQYERIEKQVDSIALHIPASMKSAYFELVKYPVSGATQMNNKWLNCQLANEMSTDKMKEKQLAEQKSMQAYTKIQQMTAYYNDTLENGKWKYMMSANPRNLPVFSKPTFHDSPKLTAETSETSDIVKNETSNKHNVDYIRLKASDFTYNNSKDFAHFQSLEGLGYSASAMMLQPYNVKLNADVSKNPSLEYEFSIEKADSALIRLYLLPIHPADSHNQSRIAVSIDGNSPQIFNIKTEGRSNAWKVNVLRNQIIVRLPWKFKATGKHKLTIYAVDADIIIDQLLIDFKMNRQFYGVGE